MNALSLSRLSGPLLHISGGALFRNLLPFFLLASSLFRGVRGGGFPLSAVIDDLQADFDAPTADVSRESSDQLFDVILAFAAETAA